MYARPRGRLEKCSWRRRVAPDTTNVSKSPFAVRLRPREIVEAEQTEQMGSEHDADDREHDNAGQDQQAEEFQPKRREEFGNEMDEQVLKEEEAGAEKPD